MIIRVARDHNLLNARAVARRMILPAVIALAVLSGPLSANAQTTCSQTIEFYATLRAAQETCGFPPLRENLVEAARSCSAQVGPDRTRDSIASGLGAFRVAEQRQGRSSLCPQLYASLRNRFH